MNKLVLTLIGVALAAIIMAQWGVNRLFSQTQNQQSSETELNQTIIQQLGQSLAISLSNSNEPETLLEQMQRPGLELSIQSPSQLELPTELQQTLTRQGYLTLQSEHDIAYIYPIEHQQQLLLINRPLADNRASTQWRLALTVLFYACIASALFFWSRPLIKRLLVLRQATRAFGEGNLQHRITTGAGSYISDIESEFNRMADRVETLIADNKLLSNAVSHDLKTPLARLRFGIDVLQDANNEEQRQKYLTKISRDLQEMEALVDTLLCYARLDQAKLELCQDTIDLVAFINELTASFDTHSIQIDWQPPPKPHFVIGDQRYLSLLINNLITNACQHAKHSISIKLLHVGNTTKLVVEDDGPGIPFAQRQAVLKPFVRGETARSTPGHGMGLAIVSRIIQWHHWHLNVGDSQSLGGAQIEVTIS